MTQPYEETELQLCNIYLIYLTLLSKETYSAGKGSNLYMLPGI